MQLFTGIWQMHPDYLRSHLNLYQSTMPVGTHHTSGSKIATYSSMELIFSLCYLPKKIGGGGGGGGEESIIT